MKGLFFLLLFCCFFFTELLYVEYNVGLYGQIFLLHRRAKFLLASLLDIDASALKSPTELSGT